jgi:hypothetical protein
MRLALEPGTGRNSVPVRSAILGTVFALMIVTSTITFGASLHTLISKPSLYGWNWTYEMNGGGGLGDIPAKPAAQLLDESKYVSAWSGVYFGLLKIDGRDTVTTTSMKLSSARRRCTSCTSRSETRWR